MTPIGVMRNNRGLNRKAMKAFVFMAFLILLTACALNPADKPNPLYWPPPPAEPYIVHEATLRAEADIRKVTLEDKLRDFSSTISAADQANVFTKPYDVVAKKGLVVVSDTLAGHVLVFDTQRGKVYRIGWRLEGKLRSPLGVALDGELNIYVADGGRNQVLVYDRLGLFLRAIGEQQKLARLSDVAVTEDGRSVYLLDRGGVESDWHRVLLYNSEGSFQRVIGKRGSGDGEFNHPVSMAVNSEGDLYVLDSGNFRVQQFEPNGQYLKSWGRPGRLMGDFARPRAMAIDRQNNVYVTDGAFQNFQIFNSQGQLLLPVGVGGMAHRPGVFALPAGISVEDTDRIFVVDQIQRKIDVFRLLNPDERQNIVNFRAE